MRILLYCLLIMSAHSETIYYGTDKVRQSMDVTVNTENWVLMVHGGSWNSGDKEQLKNFDIYDNLSTAFMNYRLNSIEAPMQEQIDDIFAAVKCIKDKYLPETLVICGFSAGGHLAGYAALKGLNVDGVILWNAPPGSHDGFMFKPLIDTNNVPFLIIHGKNDTTVKFSYASSLYQDLKDNRNNVYFHENFGGHIPTAYEISSTKSNFIEFAKNQTIRRYTLIITFLSIAIIVFVIYRVKR